MDAVEPDTCKISNYWRAPGGLRFGQTVGTAAGGPAPGWGRWWGLALQVYRLLLAWMMLRNGKNTPGKAGGRGPARGVGAGGTKRRVCSPPPPLLVGIYKAAIFKWANWRIY